MQKCGENPWKKSSDDQSSLDGQEDITMAGKLKITLVKSPIGAIPKQRATVEALGLHKIRQTVELPDNDAVKGMIWHVRELVKVEEA